MSSAILALLLVVGISNSSFAQPGDWVPLGRASVDGQRDHDSIHIRQRGTYRAIQIRVRGNDVRFDRVVVHYGNGQREQLYIRDVIRAGSASRAIDLPGARRVINRVDFWYGKARWGSRPVVSLFGLR